MRNKGLNSLCNDKQGRPYNDELCFFRCLALHKGFPITSLVKPVRDMLKTYKKKASITDFAGITLDQLEDVSRIFDLPINVYEQNDERTTKLVFLSTLETGEVLNLNLYNNHFSYIKNLEVYSQSYRCMKCDKIWKLSGNFHRHVKTCDVGVKEYYKSGAFTLKKTIFEELEDYGVYIDKEEREFPFRAAFDIECMLKKSSIPNTSKIDFSYEHDLISISVCSNVPSYCKPKCFVLEEEGQQKKLTKDMINYLLEINDASSALLREKYSEYMERIAETPLKDKFDSSLNQIPVLSFNGARYDLKVLKKYLIPILNELESINFVIKKGTSYMVISTEELKFLDVVFYTAPGFSYEAFLRAYGAKGSKSFFPYEYLDSLEKLSSTVFPEYDSFYSSLRNRNTLEPTEKTILSEEEERLIGKTPTKENPVTEDEAKVIGLSRYEKLKTTFQERSWSMKDYLMDYNNADVQPFLTALQHMCKYYTDRGVDVFKNAVSG